jgi:hypothetical protein
VHNSTTLLHRSTNLLAGLNRNTRVILTEYFSLTDFRVAPYINEVKHTNQQQETNPGQNNNNNNGAPLNCPNDAK